MKIQNLILTIAYLFSSYAFSYASSYPFALESRPLVTFVDITTPLNIIERNDSNRKNHYQIALSHDRNGLLIHHYTEIKDYPLFRKIQDNEQNKFRSLCFSPYIPHITPSVDNSNLWVVSVYGIPEDRNSVYVRFANRNFTFHKVITPRSISPVTFKSFQYDFQFQSLVEDYLIIYDTCLSLDWPEEVILDEEVENIYRDNIEKLKTSDDLKMARIIHKIEKQLNNIKTNYTTIPQGFIKNILSEISYHIITAFSDLFNAYIPFNKPDTNLKHQIYHQLFSQALSHKAEYFFDSKFLGDTQTWQIEFSSNIQIQKLVEVSFANRIVSQFAPTRFLGTNCDFTVFHTLYGFHYQASDYMDIADSFSYYFRTDLLSTFIEFLAI